MLLDNRKTKTIKNFTKQLTKKIKFQNTDLDDISKKRLRYLYDLVYKEFLLVKKNIVKDNVLFDKEQIKRNKIELGTNHFLSKDMKDGVEKLTGLHNFRKF